jgi:hypothetical protein
MQETSLTAYALLRALVGCARDGFAGGCFGIGLSGAVTSSSETNREAIRQRLTARFQGMKGGERALEAALTLLAFQEQLLRARVDNLGEAELTLSQEVGEDQDARVARDAAHAELSDYLDRLRRRLNADAGEKVTRRLGLSKPPAGRFSALEPYAKAVIQLCREASLTLTDPLTGFAYSSGAVADAVAQRLGAYQAKLTDISREVRETQAARVVRDEAADDFSQDVYAGAQLLEALYRQAGMTAHAERIRPSARRVSGRVSEDPIPPPPDAAADATGAAPPSEQPPSGPSAA